MLAVVHTELPPEAQAVSILDMGCGDGHLMAFLLRTLRAYRPALEVSLHGFDVKDSRVQEEGFFAGTLELLGREHPEIDWRPRLALIGSRDRWPYPDASFDWVISNHVLEHVRDHEFVLEEIARVLKPGGSSAHLFPVRENVLESHLQIPFSHWIRDHDRLRRYIRVMTMLGFGNYRRHRREDPTLDVARFAETRADFLTYFTNYIRKGEVLELAKRVGLRGSFRYTEHFYWSKFRELVRMPYAHRLRRFEPPVLHGLLVAGLSRISSVTMLLEKRQSYHRD